MVEEKEYEFDDIVPDVELIIEVHDDKQGQVRRAEFMVSVNGGEPREATSDDAGTIRITATAPVAGITIASGPCDPE